MFYFLISCGHYIFLKCYMLIHVLIMSNRCLVYKWLLLIYLDALVWLHPPGLRIPGNDVNLTNHPLQKAQSADRVSCGCVNDCFNEFDFQRIAFPRETHSKTLQEYFPYSRKYCVFHSPLFQCLSMNDITTWVQ